MIQHSKLLTALKISLLSIVFSATANAAGLLTGLVVQSNSENSFTAEGVVEAVQSSVIAPQVSGSVTALPVKVGDAVKAGQLLARIDTRLATQQAMTNQAQVLAAQAQLSAARSEYERKRKLFDRQYISQAALERAESDYKTAEAQTKAQIAQTGMSSVQTGLHTINAPYAGLVAEVLAEVGDMAMPGKPLLSIYSPKEMRVVVNVPQSQLANLNLNLKQGAEIKVSVAAAIESEYKVTSAHITVLPTVDSVSHMAKVRITLPQNTSGITPNIKSVITPGMFARAVLPLLRTKEQVQQLLVPSKAVIRRSELVAVYVVDKQGRPSLRQVRLGRTHGENIEVFAGLQAGEKIALDPIAAANFK